MIKRYRFYVLLALGFLAGVSMMLIKPIAAAETPNLITNPSVETVSANANLPTAWRTGVWGNNQTTFQYIKDGGQSGSKSLRVEMSQYTTGDAKWYFNPVVVQPGQDYTYSSFYKSSVTTHYIAQFTSTSGAISYVDVGQVGPAANWTEHSVRLVTPANVRSMTMFHVIRSVGWLQTDSFDLGLTEVTPPPSPTPTPTPSPSPTSTPTTTPSPTPTPSILPTNTPTPTPSPTATSTPTPTPGQENLISNPSMEIVNSSDATIPQSWSKNNWGQSNVSFQYADEGRTGSKSVKATVSNYSSGDAKWFFSPIAVSPNSVYRYSDYYISNVATRVVVAVGINNGTTQYIELAGAPASGSTWRQYQDTVTTPSNATTMTVYHLISRNGSLQIDDVSLSKFAQASDPVISNHVPNASMEQIAPDGVTPVSWTTNRWGANSATFQYLGTGHTGDRSVKTTMTSYTDGDAKWVYESQTVSPNTDYVFSDYYKSDVTTSVVARFEHSDGSVTYSTLRNASASADWTKYSDTFTTPATISKLTIYHIIQTVGFLIVDDYAIHNYSAQGFNRGLLTLTFDDGWEDNHQNVLPILNSNGLKSTQFYATQFIQDSGQESKITDFYQAGHEIGSHSVTHPDLTTLSQTSLLQELVDSKTYLENLIGAGTITNFALPYGSYNDNVLNQIKARYAANRTVDDGYNSKDNFDRYRLKVKNILSSTTSNEVNTWINKAKNDKTWLILVYHRVGANPGPFDTTPGLFQSHIQTIKSSTIPVKTMKQAIDEINPQL